MAKKPMPRPTDAELGILRILWDRGPSTVREVHEALQQSKESGYTTTLKFMQIMHEKGLLIRDESQKSHIYEAALKPEETQRQLVHYLLDKAFAGSARQLVLQALSAKKASPQELAEIRKLISDLEKETSSTEQSS